MTKKQMITDIFIIQPTIEESKSGQVKFKGVFQRADVINENGRVYPRRVLERAIKQFEEKVKAGRAVGTLEHPIDGKTKAYEISHRITNIYMNENGEVIGEGIVLETTKGKELKALLEGGVAIGISSRGFGTLKQVERDGKVVEEVQDDFELETFDVVYDPSTPGAFVGVLESKEDESNTKKEKVEEKLQDFAEKLIKAVNEETQKVLEDFAEEVVSSIDVESDVRAMLAVEAIAKILQPFIPEFSQIYEAENQVNIEEANERIKQLEEKIAQLELEKYKLEKIAEAHNPDELKDLLEEAKTKEQVDEIVSEYKRKKVIESKTITRPKIDERATQRMFKKFMF